MKTKRKVTHRRYTGEMKKKREMDEWDYISAIYSLGKPVEAHLTNLRDAIEHGKMVFYDDDNKTKINEEKWTSICYSSHSLCRDNISEGILSRLLGLFWGELRSCMDFKVLPSLMEKGDSEVLLLELVRLWGKYKQMASFFSKLMEPHNDLYQKSMAKPFKEASLDYFFNQVLREMHPTIIAAILKLLKHERYGNELPINLIKSTVDVYMESGERIRRWWEKFEHCVFQDTVEYYSRLSSKWIEKDSFKVYLYKVNRTLEVEEERMSKHLPPQTVERLLEAVRSVLVDDKAHKLIEKHFCRIYVEGPCFVINDAE